MLRFDLDFHDRNCIVPNNAWSDVGAIGHVLLLSMRLNCLKMIESMHLTLVVNPFTKKYLLQVARREMYYHKLGCILQMVIVSVLPHTE